MGNDGRGSRSRQNPVELLNYVLKNENNTYKIFSV